MGYPLMDLFLLMLSGASTLTGGTDLMVQQEPQVLEVGPGGKVNMACNVTLAKGQQFRVKWKKDGKELCRSTPISWNSSQVTWESKEKLIWIPENTIILSLDDVNANDSGHYVCYVTVDIPMLKRAEGNGTHLIVSDSVKGSWIKVSQGLLLWLLVASVIVGFGAALGKMIWRFLSRSRDSENHLYGNVLSYHPKTTTPGKGKTLACVPVRKREENLYPSSFPKPLPQSLCLFSPEPSQTHLSLHPASS
ncbi:transmembrane and immunoglobulin domain-containing protein 2 [Vombatus ursinus]|uniref:Ig-like domain-containing protein n=1 Tax=Vombatus ursinus TaxID=29139 RepID=A0A4X2M3C7_VOMUR|nr:transmembrane and immunoglobulin domain-containing protein 2 [Vombatus ursinus]